MNYEGHRDSNEIAGDINPVMEREDMEVELQQGAAEGSLEDATDTQDLRDNNNVGDSDNLRQQLEDTTGGVGAVGSVVEPGISKGKKENSDSFAAKGDLEDVMKPDVEATVSPENVYNQQNERHDTREGTESELEVTSSPSDNSLNQSETLDILERDPELEHTMRQSDSSRIRNRKYALKEMNAAAAAAADREASGAGDENGVVGQDHNIEATGTTDVTMRHSIQVTDQDERSENASETSDNMETELSLLREKKNEEDKAAQASVLMIFLHSHCGICYIIFSLKLNYIYVITTLLLHTNTHIVHIE